MNRKDAKAQRSRKGFSIIFNRDILCDSLAPLRLCGWIGLFLGNHA
jgi:hypothetical protein